MAETVVPLAEAKPITNDNTENPTEPHPPDAGSAEAAAEPPAISYHLKFIFN